MILLVTALHAEAKPFIKALGLKKDMSVRSHEIFKNDEYELIVSGIGKINSAIATTLLLTRHSNENVIIGNIGVAGAEKLETGTLCLVHKILNHSTKTAYYPEQLLKTPLVETPLTTFDKAVTDTNELEDKESIVDMEAAGFAHATSLFLDPSRYFVIKCVSDNLTCGELTLEGIEKLLIPHAPHCLMYARSLLSLVSENSKNILNLQEQETAQHVFKLLTLTESQQRLILDDLIGHKIKVGSVMDVLIPISKAKIKSTEQAEKIYNDTRQLLQPS